MGQKIVLTDSFTDLSLPILYPDPIMSAGSLILTDLGHSLGGVAGVPASSSAIPNIAYQPAATILGSGDASSLASSFLDTSFTSGEYLLERSNKGGLHGVVSPTLTDAGDNLSIRAAPAIAAYMLANPTHSFYISTWQRTTKVGDMTGGGTVMMAYTADAGVNTNKLVLATAAVFSPLGSDSTHSLGSLDASPNVLGNQIRAVGAKAWSGTVPATGHMLADEHCWGAFDSFAGNAIKAPAVIFYRHYLEDLTVSGRSFATVSAIDQGLYNTAFASGGKFFGDTYSDPTTLA